MIYIDFDQTLASAAELSDAFSRFTGLPAGGTITERFAAHDIERNKYAALTRSQAIDFWKDRGGSYTEWRNIHVIAFARPHAKVFLQACSEIATTRILTSGITAYQGRISHWLGFHGYEVLGRDAYGEVEKHPKNLLVDDLGLSTIGVQDKLTALGVKDRHIQVPVWDGRDQDDRALLDILPRIKELLA